jgi:hypothetical protein
MTVCAAVLAPSGLGAQPSPHSAVDAAAAKVREVLDAELFDYPSARFREVSADHAPRDRNFITFCGKMNGKNRVGGYTGWKAFAANVSDGQASLYMAGEGTGGIMYDALCVGGSGVPIQGDFSSTLTYRR